jgi:class 3 adenylate cyclase/tetratricopeptide (TPR) repeat protein
MATHVGRNGGHDDQAAIGPADRVGFAGFTLDVAGRSLTGPDAANISLRRSEFNLLLAFVRTPGRVLSRDHLLGAVAGRPSSAFDRSIDVLVGRLRRKIEVDPKSPTLIVTIPGVGYKFAPRPRRPYSVSAQIDTRSEPRPVERRQLTVMLCSLASLATLAADVDPEDLRPLIDRYHACCAQVISSAGGMATKYLNDTVLAWFGYPRATEHDAERAVHAGLTLIQAVSRLDQRLHCRIGLANGLVVMGALASDPIGTPSALGEAPDLAARLLAHASGDTLVISEGCQRLTRGLFHYKELPPLPEEGTIRPGRAFQVLDEAATESRFDALHDQGLTPLVGREVELDLLLCRWSQAKDGEGQVVLLSGEPGIGKSRILSALRERLDAQGIQALRFQCSPYYVNSAFWPIIDNLERVLQFTRDETTDSKLDKLEALIVTQYGRPLADVRFVASILSIPCEQRYGAVPMTPQKHKDETLRTLVDISEAAGRQKPSVMLFEDAHWADPTTAEVLDLLIDRVKAVPLLVVLTHRPEFQSRWSEQGHVGALNLSKLTRTQSAAMVSALTNGRTLPEPLLEQILTRTDGVPLFVEELTRSILESGELTKAGDRYEYAGSARTLTIPATLRDSLMARVDRFMPVREIAQIGAAIGREFSYELIAAVAPMPQAELDDSLMRLTESGLAFRRGTPPDAVYTFKHALVQDVAYDSLLKSRRQELHGKIARVIEARLPNIKTTEPEVLAHHLTKAGYVEAAIPVWQAAGELGLKRLALTEAISHLNQGLELIPTLAWSSQRDTSELELRTLLGAAWVALKGWPAAEVWTSLHPALVLAKSLERHDALAPIFLGLTGNIFAQGRVAESLPWVEQMLDLAKATGNADLLIAGHQRACACYCLAGEFTKAVRHADQVLDLYDDEKHHHLADILNHDPKTVAGIYGSMSTWILGYPDLSLRINNGKDAHARQRGHLFDLGFALSRGAHQFDRRYGHEDLRKRAKEIEQLGRENSLPVLWALMAPSLCGLALIREGKVVEGIGPLMAGIEFWESIGGKQGGPSMKASLAEGVALTGDLDDALQLIEEQIVQIERPGWEERLSYAEILRLKGWMLSLKGDPAGAEQNFLASLDWARRQQAKMWELRTSTSLARLWQSQGKRQDAYGLLAPVYAWFTEGFDTKDLQEAKSLLTELR